MTTTVSTTPALDVQESAPGPVPPPLAMLQMITGAVWVTKAIYVAAELGIADLVAAEPQTPAALAAATASHAPSLYRVLRALASLGIFAEDEAGRFGLTPLAATLRSDAPGSLRAMAQLWGHPEHWQVWGSLLAGVQTGRVPWEIATHGTLFEYFGRNPAMAALFDRSMSAFSAQEAGAVALAYDFGGIDTLVDVGGGQGLLLATILRAFPGVRGMLFEQPAVLPQADELMREQGVRDRCTLAAGDFFAAVPAGADAYILKNILHDFPDEPAVRILANCAQAMRAGGRVLVVQEPIPPGNDPSAGKLLDLQMLLIGGQERTAAEYGALFTRAGLRLRGIMPTLAPLSVLEAVAL